MVHGLIFAGHDNGGSGLDGVDGRRRHWLGSVWRVPEVMVDSIRCRRRDLERLELDDTLHAEDFNVANASAGQRRGHTHRGRGGDVVGAVNFVATGTAMAVEERENDMGVSALRQGDAQGDISVSEIPWFDK